MVQPARPADRAAALPGHRGRQRRGPPDRPARSRSWASFADLGVKTRSQKITSVNFVPPLIKPWDYDPRVITSTVGKTIAASEGASATTAAAKAPGHHHPGAQGPHQPSHPRLLKGRRRCAAVHGPRRRHRPTSARCAPQDEPSRMTPTAEARTAPAALSAVPSVSVIMPVLNEERHLARRRRDGPGQDYAGPLEVVLALGPSTDRTDEVAAGLAAADPRVRTVANPTRPHPQRAQRGDRRLAPTRSSPASTATPRSRRTTSPPRWPSCERVGADNVGGIMDAAGHHALRAGRRLRDAQPAGRRAAPASTPAAAPATADTVYLGVFRRSGARAGRRLRRALRPCPGLGDEPPDPRDRRPGLVHARTCKVTYRRAPRPRPSARQYFHYGRWRRVVARHHARHDQPALPRAAGDGRRHRGGHRRGDPVAGPAWLVPAAYGVAIAAGGLAISRGEPRRARPATPARARRHALVVGDRLPDQPAVARPASRDPGAMRVLMLVWTGSRPTPACCARRPRSSAPDTPCTSSAAPSRQDVRPRRRGSRSTASAGPRCPRGAPAHCPRPSGSPAGRCCPTTWTAGSPAGRHEVRGLLAGERAADVVHAHDFTALPVGAELAARWGVPLVYDSHELWSGRPGRGPSGAAAGAAATGGARRSSAARRPRSSPSATASPGRCAPPTGGSACAWFATPSRAARTCHRRPRRRDAWCMPGGWRPTASSRWWPRPAAVSTLPITLVGPADQDLARGFDPGRAEQLPPEGLPRVDDACWRPGLALVTHSDRWANHRLALPNKLFHAVSLGVPVVATDVGELGAIVREHGVGTLYRPGTRVAGPGDRAQTATGRRVRSPRRRDAVLGPWAAIELSVASGRRSGSTATECRRHGSGDASWHQNVHTGRGRQTTRPERGHDRVLRRRTRTPGRPEANPRSLSRAAESGFDEYHVYEPHKVGLPPLVPYFRELWRPPRVRCASCPKTNMRAANTRHVLRPGCGWCSTRCCCRSSTTSSSTIIAQARAAAQTSSPTWWPASSRSTTCRAASRQARSRWSAAAG